MQSALGHHSGWTGVSTLNLKTLCISTASCLVGSLIVIYYIEAAACCYKNRSSHINATLILLDSWQTLSLETILYTYILLFTQDHSLLSTQKPFFLNS